MPNELLMFYLSSLINNFSIISTTRKDYRTTAKDRVATTTEKPITCVNMSTVREVLTREKKESPCKQSFALFICCVSNFFYLLRPPLSLILLLTSPSSPTPSWQNTYIIFEIFANNLVVLLCVVSGIRKSLFIE